MEAYRRGELVFDVIGAGPADGPVAVLWTRAATGLVVRIK
jgi:hypothetical protein